MKPPAYGPTGSRVVESTISAAADKREHRYLPPLSPTREVYTCDDDGEINGSRSLTDEEFAAASAAYDRAAAEYKRTGGVHVELGSTTFSVSVRCADGTRATAIGDGTRWRWTGAENAPADKPIDLLTPPPTC